MAGYKKSGGGGGSPAEEEDSPQDPKARGDRAMESGRASEAAEAYSQALQQHPGDPVLLSNRSAARAGAGDYLGALDDASRAAQARPTWAKAHSRRGDASSPTVSTAKRPIGTTHSVDGGL